MCASSVQSEESTNEKVISLWLYHATLLLFVFAKPQPLLGLNDTVQLKMEFVEVKYRTNTLFKCILSGLICIFNTQTNH